MSKMTFKEAFKKCDTDFILDILKHNCGNLIVELKKPLTPPTKSGRPSKRPAKGHRTVNSHCDTLALIQALTEILSDRYNP